MALSEQAAVAESKKFGMRRDISVRIYVSLAQRIILGDAKMTFQAAAEQSVQAAKFIMAEVKK